MAQLLLKLPKVGDDRWVQLHLTTSRRYAVFSWKRDGWCLIHNRIEGAEPWQRCSRATLRDLTWGIGFTYLRTGRDPRAGDGVRDLRNFRDFRARSGALLESRA